MQGAFSLINENMNSAPFKTLPLENRSMHDVFFVSLVIRDHFLDGDWKILVQKGSVSLQSESHPDQVAKVFVDYDNRLATECGISIHEEPVVVGFELTHLPAFVRDAVRDSISARSGSYYIDPRVPGNSKRWLQPVDFHHYDILFLTRGECDYEIDTGELERLQIS